MILQRCLSSVFIKNGLKFHSRAIATKIDGVAVAAKIKEELKKEVQELSAKHGKVPGLAVVLVGERRDSQSYVKSKKQMCKDIGMNSFGFDFPDTIAQEDLLRKIDELNHDANVHGILIQLPLPPHINEKVVIESILKEKDVDGLHPLNVAELVHSDTRSGARKQFSFSDLNYHVACTPQGCIELLDRSGVTIEGKSAVVLGRSNIVGMPVALLLIKRHATVTVAHSRTTSLKETMRGADIVIAAIGKAGFVKADMLKPGAVVIDVGINPVDDPTAARGYRLVGDVDYSQCKEVASLITPVPGGVGPMTIAMLMRNTVASFKRSLLKPASTHNKNIDFYLLLASIDVLLVVSLWGGAYYWFSL